MRLLLDTHLALWWITGNPATPATARSLIEDPSNLICVSAVSVWEIAIKFARPKGLPDDMPISGSQALDAFVAAGFEWVPVLPEHAAAVDRLPPVHKDPFDRLLIAQALTEPLRLMTRDDRLAAYGSMVMTV